MHGHESPPSSSSTHAMIPHPWRKERKKRILEQCVVKAVVSDPRPPDPAESGLNSLGEI